MNGAAGGSGADADMWKRLLYSNQLKNKPYNLCNVVAWIGRKLNTVVVNPSYLRAFVAGHLIPLDKKPPRGNVEALHACTLREVGTAQYHNDI